MTKLSDLKPSHQKFIKKYIETSNLAKSYKYAYPNIGNLDSASISGGRLLGNVRIKEVLDRTLQETHKLIDLKIIASREKLVNEAHSVLQRANKKDLYNTELSAIRLKGDLTGAFKDDNSTGNEFNVWMQQFITINQADKRPETAKADDKTIEVTPEYLFDPDNPE